MTSALESSSTNELLIDDATVYKETSKSDLVVPRKLQLFRTRFLTYHDYSKDPSDYRTWYLDRHCQIDPPSASDIGERCIKWVRPRGTWTITAMATTLGSKEHEIVLFRFMFDSQALAVHWHKNLSDSIVALQRFAGELAPLTKAGSSTKLATSPALTPVPSDNSKERLRPLLPESHLGGSRTAETSGSLDARRQPHAAGPRAPAPLLQPDVAPDGSVAAASSTSGDVDEDLSRARQQVLSEHWVPYRQTNGVAVYHHIQQDDTTGVGGEYMVSAVVRGTPRQALDALMSTHANTHILGPAKSVEVLTARSEAKVKEDRREVLRLVLEPPGIARRFCAPRELVVERVLKRDEPGGLFVVLFSSCEPPVSAPPLQQAGWLHRAVRGKVRGAWSIAPLEDHKLDTSPESLVTCIIKADLGGIFSEQSWFKGVADGLGWTDAFLDRILMTVTIIRDEVEHRRFSVHPLSLLSGGPARASGCSQEEGAQLQGVGSMPNFGKMSTRLGHQRTRSRANASPPGEPLAHFNISTTFPTEQAGAAAAAGTAVSGGSLTSAFSSAAAMGAGWSAGGADTGGGQGSARLSAFSGGCTPAAGMVEEADEEQVLDLEHIRSLSLLPHGIWEDIHTPGKDAPFRVRGPTYLKDRKKIPAGEPQFLLSSMDVVELEPGQPSQHIARFIPAIRQSGAPFAVVINLIIPGTPLLCIVTTFVNEHHPDSMGEPPKHPMEEQHGWQPFDLALHRYLHGNEQTRAAMFKLIPHIADGSWIIKSSVGTTPVIIGKALKTNYYETNQYLEIDIDVSANHVAAYVTGLVRSATKSLVIDMAFVLEGQTPWELPESILGCMRLNYLDLKLAKKIDTTKEIPLKPAIGGSHPIRPVSMSRSTSERPPRQRSHSDAMSPTSLPQRTTDVGDPAKAYGSPGAAATEDASGVTGIDGGGRSSAPAQTSPGFVGAVPGAPQVGSGAALATARFTPSAGGLAVANGLSNVTPRPDADAGVL